MLLSKRRVKEEWVDYLADGKTPAQIKKDRLRWLRIYDLFGSVATAIIIIFIVFTFICRPTSVVGDSMNNTLLNGDWLITMHKSEYKYGDIVIITQPNTFNEPIVKRVIATAGQTVDINFVSGQVFVDGKELNETYIKEETHHSFDKTFPLTVPDGCLFVMGDNRNNSTDSRSSDIGFIDTRYVLGKAEFRILPLGDFNIYDNFNGVTDND